jgi:hypothetical protein
VPLGKEVHPKAVVLQSAAVIELFDATKEKNRKSISIPDKTTKQKKIHRRTEVVSLLYRHSCG